MVGIGVAAKVGGQRRGRIGGRDHHQAGVAEDWRSGGGSDGAGRADDADDSGVADHRIRGGTSAFLSAERVEAGAHLDIVPFDRAIVSQGQRHTALARGAQVTKPCKDVHRTYLDGLSGCHLHGSEGTGFEALSSA